MYEAKKKAGLLDAWMDKKHQSALLEGGKKAACVATNAAMWFYFPDWVFGDTSLFPADPVWVHITIVMLCELDTMDRLSEKILLRTAGTTFGALAGILMTFSGLTDPQRLTIVILVAFTFGFVEKLDPSRSYTWTIATVTFGICTYLGRMGKPWTPWKRWWSIILGTIVTCIWQLLLPQLGVLPRKIVRDELGENAKAAFRSCLTMLEDALENSGDAEAVKRLSEQQASTHGLLGKWTAGWKQYSYARNWLNLQPKKVLPMHGLRQLLKGPLLDLFLSCSAAARMLHHNEPLLDFIRKDKEAYAAFRADLHKISLHIDAAIPVIATKAPPEQTLTSGKEELDNATLVASGAEGRLLQFPAVHQAVLDVVLQDLAKVVSHLQGILQDASKKAV